MRFLLEATGWSEFYKKGFFGYGEEGEFQFFSFWHFLPILLLIAGIVLTYIFREKIKASKHEKTFRLIMGIVLLLAEMGYFWRVLYVGPGNDSYHTLLTKLPLQVCEWTCIFAVFMVLTENKHFFDIDVFVCLTVGLLPLFVPAVITDCGPKYFRYYQFWLEHLLPIYAVFYMMFIKDFKYDIKKIYKSLIFLFILGCFCIYFNTIIPDAHYMYLQGDDLGKTLTSILPTNQFLRLLVFLTVVSALYGLEFLVFFIIRKVRSKKQLKEENIQTE